MARCPAMLVSAPASGQGKTLVTAALARRHRQAGRKVRVFKCGPDFLDPMILEQASGAPVYQLDLFMGGEDHCRALLHKAAQEADLILVEGVMGLFDGDPSAADLAARFNLPVMAVINGAAMAQSFGAIALGLASYREDIRIAGVLANHVGSERHGMMLRESLRGDVQWLGAVLRNSDIALPERHLGLVQAAEIADLDQRIAQAASALPAEAEWLPPAVDFPAPSPSLPPAPADSRSHAGLAGKRIAIARDAAFSFIYPANLDILHALGAELHFFSPLADEALPECDALWLPGGYPELHGAQLAGNRAMADAIRAHHAAGKPILAECGGMLYCTQGLAELDGTRHSMLGLIVGQAQMQSRLAALGLQRVSLDGGDIRGHSFHFSRLDTDMEAVSQAHNPNGGPGEKLYRQGNLTASYVHFYFPSNPALVAGLLGG